MPDARLLGRVRGLWRDQGATNNENERPHLSGQSELLIAPAAAPYSEITRQGQSYYVNTYAAGTGIGGVIVLPTTAFLLGIWNGEPDNGKSYVIDTVGMYCSAAPATQCQAGIIACLGQTRVAAPADSALTIKKTNGFGTLASHPTNAICTINTTADAVTGTALNWFPLGSSIITAATTTGGWQQVVNVDGRIIVPPGRAFLLSAMVNAVTVLTQWYLFWTEKQLALG